MSYHIHIQNAGDRSLSPATSLLRTWAKTALKQQGVEEAEVTLRLVNIEEMTYLNETYRRKKGPTNVLSFPMQLPEIVAHNHLLGDIVICSNIIQQEANDQHIPVANHWAHMVVHGILHLLGHDHLNEDDAAQMEKEEISILNLLGFENPYSTQ